MLLHITDCHVATHTKLLLSSPIGECPSTGKKAAGHAQQQLSVHQFAILQILFRQLVHQLQREQQAASPLAPSASSRCSSIQ
jgi:hypothetical protein